MTSRYRVEYALKSHRRDELIEWIKGLLAVPFVLHADVENYKVNREQFSTIEEYEEYCQSRETEIADECRKRYLEIFGDVELLIEHSRASDESTIGLAKSRLQKMVPSVGKFFTSLPLKRAFLIEDSRRHISRRRYVSPSFNDVRHILNAAQILVLADLYKELDLTDTQLKLITFDGDVTLYEDGESLTSDSPITEKLIKLLSMGFFLGVVTAAGYPGQNGASKYYERLKGLVDGIRTSKKLSDKQKQNLLVMGGESNYLFRYDSDLGNLKFIDGKEWYLPLMKSWDSETISSIVDSIYYHLKHLQKKFNLEDKTIVIKKERSIGIIPNENQKILREQLEEMAVSCSARLEDLLHKLRNRNKGSDDDIKICAFNGGSDVWVDIGDKSLGVESLQRFLCKDLTYHHLCPILKHETLHIGDQFASVGANDFRARQSACTVWIANPKETLAILDELINHVEPST